MAQKFLNHQTLITWRWIALIFMAVFSFVHCTDEEVDPRQAVDIHGMTLNELILDKTRDCKDLSGLYPQELIDGLGFQLIEEMRCMDPHWLEYYTPCKEAGCIWANGPQPLAARPEVLSALRDAATSKNDFITINAAYRDVGMQYFSRWRTENCDKNFPAAVPGNSNHQGGRAIDVQSYNYWWDTLVDFGFEHPLANDRPHFELVGSQKFRDESEELKVLGVKAFQRLWNKNNPDDQIDEDGIYGPMTKERLGNSHIEGFELYGCLEPETCQENPCGEGCLESTCDAFCQQNPCVEACGQERCDAYCDVNPCGEGCDPALCSAYCDATPCGVGCDPQQCIAYCDANPCSPDCDNTACEDICVLDPCDASCDQATCDAYCAASPCADGCDEAACDAHCAASPCADGCDQATCDAYCDAAPCADGCDQNACDAYCQDDPCQEGCDPAGCRDVCVDTPCADGCDPQGCTDYCDDQPCGVGCDAATCRQFCDANPCGAGCPTQKCAVFCIKSPCDPACGQEACDAFCETTPCASVCPSSDACAKPDQELCRDDECEEPTEGDDRDVADLPGRNPGNGDGQDEGDSGTPPGTDSLTGDGKSKGCASTGGTSVPWASLLWLSAIVVFRRRKPQAVAR